MEKINNLLEAASFDELLQIQKDLDKLIKRKEKQAKRDKITELKRMAAEFGLDITVNASDKTASTSKYTSPNNSELTWSGKGRKPKWVQEHLDNGGNLEELEG